MARRKKSIIPSVQSPLEPYLLAYILYILGTLFPTTHGDIVSASLIKFAEIIVDEPLPPYPTYSLGSAMLAHTYRGLCDATQKTSAAGKGQIFVVYYDFLQLWSWEYLPVGRPRIVNPIHPYNSNNEEHAPLTNASRWTHATK